MISFVVFAKEPRPGAVKTRLVPPLTHDEAARLAAAFARDLVRRLAEPGGAEIRIALPTGDSAAGWMEGLGFPVRIVDQGDGTLGDRLGRALGDALEDGARVAVAIGADHPDLPRGMLQGTVDAALRGQVGWIPTEDGGYAALAVDRAWPGLFDRVPWSTPEVAEATRNNARSLGVTLVEAGTWRDVDDVEDLRRLAAEPELLRRCPETAEVLKALGPDALERGGG